MAVLPAVRGVPATCRAQMVRLAHGRRACFLRVHADALAHRVAQKSILITTRRGVGWLTTLRPADANTPGVPTCNSSRITSVVMIG